MLLELSQWLAKDYRAFSVFNYITLRAVLATLTALFIGLIFGPAVIRRLTEMKIGQAVRNDGPQTHLIKSGTPTMGGVLVLISVGLATLLWADLENRFVWIVLIATLATRVANTFADALDLVTMPPPLSLPKFQMAVAWHERNQDDPPHRWLREQLLTVAADVR